MRKRFLGVVGVAFLVQSGVLAAGQASASGPAVVCDDSIPPGTTIQANVIVPSGKSCFIDGTVIGNVYGQGSVIGESGVLPGAFVVINGKVNGDVYSQGDPSIVGVSGAFVVINGTVTGDGYGQPGAFELAVTGDGVVRGDVFGSDMNYVIVQSGGTVKGSVRAEEMSLSPFGQASVQVNGGNVGADVKITTTDLVVIFGSQVNGDVTVTDSSTVLVGGNVVNGDLTCLNNAAVSVLGSPSVVRGDAKGQCADL